MESDVQLADQGIYYFASYEEMLEHWEELEHTPKPKPEQFKEPGYYCIFDWTLLDNTNEAPPHDAATATGMYDRDEG